MWINVIKTKDEVFDLFNNFKALVENQRNRRIEILITYVGGKYTSKAFKEYSIRLQFDVHLNIMV